MRKKKEWVKEEQCVLSLLISGYFEDMLISYWARGKIWPVGRSSSSLTIKNHYHVHLYEPLNGQNTPSDISCFLLSPFGFFSFLVLLSTYWYCHAGLLSEYGNLDSNIILLISFHIVAYNPMHDKQSWYVTQTFWSNWELSYSLYSFPSPIRNKSTFWTGHDAMHNLSLIE